MSVTATMIDAMLEAGCTAEQIAAVVKADLAERDHALTEKRAKDAERQRRHRLSRDVTVTDSDSVTPPPLSRPPNENISNPPTHTPPDIYPARAKPNDFPRLDCVPEPIWRDFLRNRKAKRLPCTATAHRKLARDLETMAARTGWPPGEVFEACVAKGWGAIYDPRDKANGQAKPDKRSGAASAIDRRFGFGDVAGEAGRSAIGDGAPDSGRALALPPPGQ